MEYDFVGNRENIRKHERSPFFLPETPQEGFYSETLTGLLTAKYKAKTLWNT